MKHRLAFMALSAALACASQASADTLTVGAGKTYALPSAAAAAAQAGDTIQIFPGTYTDCTQWNADRLVIEGIGPDVVITGPVCGDKGLFITRGSDITVRNLTFKSAHATTHNGAGIRAEGGATLTVENSRFIDNEDGILGGLNSQDTIIVRNSSFQGNGNCIALCAHGIYIGHITLLRVENSQFTEQHEGHHIKSRAARTEIVGSTIQDNQNGSASYLVDMPNGGSALISGNQFEKGPKSQNRQVAISVGAEGASNPAGEIIVKDNVFTNDTGVATAFVKNYSTLSVTLSGNRFSGAVTPISGPPAPGNDAGAAR
jgi:hypothetical protein